MKVLVTGAAGFIGFHLVQRLLGRGDEVVGLDNLSDYYSVALKEARLAQVRSDRFRFVRMDLADREALPALFAAERFDAVVNLAAQAGVRYSVENPWAYVDSNVVGFLNVLECCRHYPVRHLVYASSSSVYGGNEKTPFSEEDRVDDPVSLYAATKKSDELMAGCYAHLYGLKVTGLRLFTVYGPWGRPDMSPMLFASAILAGRPVKVFNHGDMLRDFTYVDDIVEGMVRVLDRVPQKHEVYNIGCSNPVRLMDFISELERALGREAEKIMLPMQPGDVYQTYADTTKLERELGYKPGVMLREGVDRFVAWYLSDQNPLR
ncbi:UDP-glucuronate 4-epimerase [Bacteroidales bacterium WCE2004]|nr:UDP-glucuronate 4-epimerase [Bacteroidales bacterium WCE2004]